MKRGKKIAGICFIVVIAGILLLGADIWASRKVLSVSRYTCENEKLNQSIKIVQLSDLHNSQFGEKNRRLVRKVRKEEPDVIFLTGDMLNDDEERTDILIDLIGQLREIAPVYASLGNHERDYIKNYGTKTDLVKQMEEAGAVVLEKEYVDTEIKGQEVRIGGVYGYVLGYTYQDGSEQVFMEDFVDTDRMKILLSHIPEGLLLWKSMEHWDVDLVFSGHVHGGQIRLPFVGGLFDPEEGFFPTYTKGMFSCGYGTMILSAGLGNSARIPRVNNLPDVVVCEVSGTGGSEAN